MHNRYDSDSQRKCQLEKIIIEMIVRVNVFIMIKKVQANLFHSKPGQMLSELNEQQLIFWLYLVSPASTWIFFSLCLFYLLPYYVFSCINNILCIRNAATVSNDFSNFFQQKVSPDKHFLLITFHLLFNIYSFLNNWMILCTYSLYRSVYLFPQKVFLPWKKLLWPFSI